MSLPFESLIPLVPRVPDIDYAAAVYECESSSEYGDEDQTALET